MSNQVPAWDAPGHGATGWDASLIAEVEALRTAHNATDGVAASALQSIPGNVPRIYLINATDPYPAGAPSGSLIAKKLT